MLLDFDVSCNIAEQDHVAGLGIEVRLSSEARVGNRAQTAFDQPVLRSASTMIMIMRMV